METTLDPNARTLLKVEQREDDSEVGMLFSELMGDIVEPRRIFIQDNALERREFGRLGRRISVRAPMKKARIARAFFLFSCRAQSPIVMPATSASAVTRTAPARRVATPLCLAIHAAPFAPRPLLVHPLQQLADVGEDRGGRNCRAMSGKIDRHFMSSLSPGGIIPSVTPIWLMQALER